MRECWARQPWQLVLGRYLRECCHLIALSLLLQPVVSHQRQRLCPITRMAWGTAGLHGAPAVLSWPGAPGVKALVYTGPLQSHDLSPVHLFTCTHHSHPLCGAHHTRYGDTGCHTQCRPPQPLYRPPMWHTSTSLQHAAVSTGLVLHCSPAGPCWRPT